MTEPATVKRLNRAINSAYKILGQPEELYSVIRLNDSTCPFQIERTRRDEEKGDEIIKFRIVIDEITESDISQCREYPLNKNIFTKFILCRLRDQKDFIWQRVES